MDGQVSFHDVRWGRRVRPGAARSSDAVYVSGFGRGAGEGRCSFADIRAKI